MVNIQLYFQNAILQFCVLIHYEGFSSSPPSPDIYYHSPEPKITDMHLLYSRMFLPKLRHPESCPENRKLSLKNQSVSISWSGMSALEYQRLCPDLSPSRTLTNQIAEEILYIYFAAIEARSCSISCIHLRVS